MATKSEFLMEQMAGSEAPEMAEPITKAESPTKSARAEIAQVNPSGEKELLELSRKLVHVREQATIEPRALARSIDVISELYPDNPDQQRQILTGYFQGRENFNFEKPERLADEILTLEQELIAKFKEEVAAEYPQEDEQTKAKREQTINAVREGIFSMILGGRLKAEHITGLLNGGLHFKKAPGEELAQGETFPAEEMTAYTSLEEGVLTVHFYEKFTESGPDDNAEQQIAAQAHIVRHEFSHVLAATEGIWDGKDYDAFLGAAKTLNAEQIQAVSESHPELGGILAVMQKPEAHPLWNHYLRGRFEKLTSLPEKDRPEERVRIANELVAEMIAFNLEGGKTPEEYFCARLRFTEPERIVNYLTAVSGKETAEEFCKAYGINPKEDTPSIILGKLAKYEEFATLLKVNKAWFEKLKESFANRGEKIKATVPPDKKMRYPDDYDLENELGWYSDYGFGSSTEREGAFANAKAENPLVVIWEFLTGQKSQKMAA